MNRRLVLALGLVALLMVAGCTGQQEQHAVAFGGAINHTNGTFTMNGELQVVGGTAAPQTYPNVTVVLYAANKTWLDAVPVGTMSAYGDTPMSRTINITRPYQPAYVVFESPGFWRDSRTVPVDAYHWDRSMGAYESYSVSDSDEKFSED